MRKLVITMAMVLGSALASTGPVLGDEKGTNPRGDGRAQPVLMSPSATVPIQQAITAASEKVPGTVIEAVLKKRQGKVVWELEVVAAEGKVMEVRVDAGSGTVTEIEEKKGKKSDRKRQTKRKPRD